MSDAVKVGDQFKLPVHVGDRGAIVQSDGEGIDYLKLDLMVSCIAINNHDRLQQENAELREVLKSTLDLSERLVVNALTLAKHDYPLSPSAGIQLKDWKVHEQRIQSLLNKNN